MARMPALVLVLVGLLPAAFPIGCSSPSHADQDALFGGLGGEGTGRASVMPRAMPARSRWTK